MSMLFLAENISVCQKQIKNVENVNKGTTQSISCFFKQQQKQKNTVCSGSAIVGKRERETVSVAVQWQFGKFVAKSS